MDAVLSFAHQTMRGFTQGHDRSVHGTPRSDPGVDRGGGSYALCGGLALMLYQRPRATVDIDLIVTSDATPDVAAALAPLGFRPHPRPMRFAPSGIEILRFYKAVPGSPDVLTLDCLLTTHPTVAKAWQSRLQVPFEASVVSVVSAEGLIALKRLRGSPQDLLDIAGLESLERSVIQQRRGGSSWLSLSGDSGTSRNSGRCGAHSATHRSGERPNAFRHASQRSTRNAGPTPIRSPPTAPSPSVPPSAAGGARNSTRRSSHGAIASTRRLWTPNRSCASISNPPGTPWVAPVHRRTADPLRPRGSVQFVGFHRRIGCRAARVSSIRLTRGLCGAARTTSGSSRASRAISCIAAIN